MEIDEQTLIFRAEGGGREVAAMAGWGGRGFSDVGAGKKGFSPNVSCFSPRDTNPFRL